MTDDAEKRLRVLEEHTDLGAGYRIALHDLEMRGAGNLLGADQSGFIAAVGFETYLRLLEETIAGLKGEEERPAVQPELAFDADAFLPDGYVPDAQQKLALYRRLSRLRDPAAIEDFRAELQDRYGPLPEPAAHLVDAVTFKVLAARAGLARIRIRPREARAELRWPPGIEPRLKAIQRSAEVRGVGLEIQGLDPFRLALAAADYDSLREALQGIVVAFETAA
jgi:transcription-repair coupling factor (superfamily II helicase)